MYIIHVLFNKSQYHKDACFQSTDRFLEEQNIYGWYKMPWNDSGETEDSAYGKKNVIFIPSENKL